jgi:hypothetical protein
VPHRRAGFFSYTIFLVHGGLDIGGVTLAVQTAIAALMRAAKP